MPPFYVPALMMIASGSIHAMVNAIIKSGRSKMASRAATDGTSALLLLPGVLLVPWPAGAWPWLALSTAVHCVYLLALVKSYETADFSAAYPVLRGTAPLVTALVTIGLLGERASFAETAGIACLGGGILMLAIGRHLDRASLGWALLTGVCIAGYTVADAHGVRAAPTAMSYVVWDFVLMGPTIIAQFAVMTRGAVFAEMAETWRPCAIAGLLSVVTYGLALNALALGSTAPLAALRETGMLTALVIAILAFGERVTARRALAIVAILAGTALILHR